jgi:hypothetical protein
MKKLLFAAAALFFSCAAYAQYITPDNDFGPKELKCTEEAITFRLTVRPGGQLGSFRFGYTDYTNSPSGFLTAENQPGGDIIAEPLQLVKYQNMRNQQDPYANMNFLFTGRTINPLMHAIQFPNGQFFYVQYNFLHFLNFPPGEQATVAKQKSF